MAHQAHALPWQTIADHFKFVYKKRAYYGRTNLYPCFKRDQGSQLQHFARVFARLMDHASAQEREKYPEELIPPEEEEIFIPDHTTKRIEKTIKWYKRGCSKHTAACHSVGLCRTGYLEGTPPLSEEERKLPYWRDSFETVQEEWPRYDLRQSVELLKTLLLYNEMEPLLRLVAHPSIRLPMSYARLEYGEVESWCTDIRHSALTAYIGLNMFVVKPELYDPATRLLTLAEMKKKYRLAYTPEMFDYRNTSAYQNMLTRLTYTSRPHDHSVCPLPHREFFGIEKDMITTSPYSRLLQDRVGQVPPSQLLDARYRLWYVPTASDVSTVLSIVQTRVPAELALEILEHADYTAKRRIPVPNDPLHADNAQELKKYLSYCWKVLVRIDMLVKADGRWIDWEYEVTDVMYDLWGVLGPKKMSTTVSDWEYDGRQEGEIDPGRVRRTFI
jgi:hypothetical protein